MDRMGIIKLVDETVEGLLEGGPGSGPQKGGGKKSDADSSGKFPRYPSTVGKSKYTTQAQTLSKNVMRWERSGSKFAAPGHAQAAKIHERGIKFASEDYPKSQRDKVVAYHKEAAAYHWEREKVLSEK